nr:ImmA/IrrE family metallo-endopeptidase [uncultured Methylophaga sp.]
MDRHSINEQARNLLLEIWKEKERIWPNQQKTPIEIINVQAAAQILGVNYLELPNLGDQRFALKGRQYAVAGLLDRQANKIAVSTEHTPEITRFTGAHEIGHFLMHPGEVMHRDMPLDGSSKIGQRNEREKEADYFAACFLVPEKLLLYHFNKQFLGNVPFAFDDTTSFHLNPDNPNHLLRSEQSSLEREFALARCTSYNGKHFHSLSNIFKVSNSVMAIRMKELGLVRWP